MMLLSLDTTSAYRPTGAAMASLKAFSAYNIPSVEAIVCYLHVATGFYILST